MAKPKVIPVPSVPAPDIVRAGYIEIIVSDLAKSREFYVDILGLIVTYEDDEAIYLRTFEEFIHHNLILRKGPEPAIACFSWRVRSPEDVDKAEAYYRELGCDVRRGSFVKGIPDAVRVLDPLGFPYEFFYEVEHVERNFMAYDKMTACPLVRFEHFNQVYYDVENGTKYLENLGFGVAEQIADDEGNIYATWVNRTATVHDTSLTAGSGPAMHHMAFMTPERSNVLDLCDKLGALRKSDIIERGPGRHGVSNAFYLYLRDPDGHRMEIYTSDYYTGDPDNPTVTWDVHDNQRRSWWGHSVVTSWYAEASRVLNLDGELQPIETLDKDNEMDVTVGADGFSYTRKEDVESGVIGPL